VRTPTKIASTLIAAGALAISYKLGAAPATGLVAASGDTENSLNGTSEPQASATPSASASPTPSASSSTKKTPTPKKTTPAKASGGGNTNTGNTGNTGGGNTNTGNTGGGTTQPTTTTKTGDVVYENRWHGQVQLSVTKDSTGKITSINAVSFIASGPAWGTQDTLIQAALAAQGSNFGNLSRATFTTNAFKQALDSALAKF
jgi:uncharacterized protein with FMN-binding domain